MEFSMQVTSIQLNVKTKRDDSLELSRFFVCGALNHKRTRVLLVNKLGQLN